MVEHIVLFKWKAGTPPETLAAIVEGLRGLKDKIETIVELTVGENFSERSQGFTHGLVVRFADRAGLAAYGPHPAHQEVVTTLINPNREEIVVVDYEI